MRCLKVLQSGPEVTKKPSVPLEMLKSLEDCGARTESPPHKILFCFVSYRPAQLATVTQGERSALGKRGAEVGRERKSALAELSVSHGGGLDFLIPLGIS